MARHRRGFTLLEILLSLAILALLASVLVGGASHLTSQQPVTPDDVFWEAVREARKAALKAEHEMRLRFDKEKKQFVLVDGEAPPTAASLTPTLIKEEEVPLKIFPVPERSAGDLTVDFLSAQKCGLAILVGGVVMESQPIPFVTFYGDGTCTAFRAQFARNGGSHTLSIDPWTCAPVLTPADPNAPNVR
jgi:prepilin-type N-terminal cleavage/methylation domain-containing protein